MKLNIQSGSFVGDQPTEGIRTEEVADITEFQGTNQVATDFDNDWISLLLDTFQGFLNVLCKVEKEQEEETMKSMDGNSLTVASQAAEKQTSSMERNPLRKVLSPICSNINRVAQQEATPPKTPLHTLQGENNYNSTIFVPFPEAIIR